MTEKRFPAVDKAMGYVREIVRAHGVDGSNRLPGIHALAKDAGVSYTSMWKALQVLRGERLLEGYSGGRFRIAGAGSAEGQGQAARLPRVQTLKNALFRDVLSGRFAAGSELPSQKELTQRYGSAYRSVNRALRELCAEGLLQPHKRSFRVSVASGARPTARVVLLCHGEEQGRLLSSSTRNNEFFGTVEKECGLLNVKLDLFTCFLEGDSLVSFDKSAGTRSSPIEGDDLLGCLVLASPWRELMPRMIGRAWTLRKPVAVFDDVGTPTELYSDRRAASTRVFRVATGELHGERVGRFLLHLGHRRVAFLRETNAGRWAQERLNGLRRVYESAGLADGVTVLDLRPHGGPTRDEIAAIDEMTLRSFLDLYARRRNDMPAGTLITMEGAAPGLFADVLAQERAEVRLAADLDALPKHNPPTALVCWHDRLALNVLDCLRNRPGVRVPRDVSVIGFDNIYASLTNSLTTYDFNIGVAIRSMLRFCISPERWASRGGNVEMVDGMIVERGTTARCSS
jgi:DNA-binding FadR family transcriptional regulator